MGVNTYLYSSTLSEHLSLLVKSLFTIGRIDSGLTFAVADFHLAEDLLQRCIPPGQELVQQRADIPATQQRSSLLVKLTFCQQEQHRHHDQRQVMVPAAPTPDLIVTQPDVLFAGLQGAFHPIPLPCMNASRAMGVSAGALLRLYLISVGVSTSRRTIKCHGRAWASSSSHNQTR